MTEAEAVVPVSAELVQRLRQLTDLPWMECKRFLTTLTPDKRALYIEAIQNNRNGILHDPIEDDPTVQSLYLAACEEATREVQEWHRQHIAELEEQSPAVADLFRNGSGLCHRIWARIKELLRERHGIEWRSPREMNPWVIFD